MDSRNEEPAGMDGTVDEPATPIEGNDPDHGSADVHRQRETKPMKVFGEQDLPEDFLSQERFLSPVVDNQKTPMSNLLSNGLKQFCVLLALPEGSQENKLLLNPEKSKTQKPPELLLSRVIGMLSAPKEQEFDGHSSLQPQVLLSQDDEDQESSSSSEKKQSNNQEFGHQHQSMSDFEEIVLEQQEWTSAKEFRQQRLPEGSCSQDKFLTPVIQRQKKKNRLSELIPKANGMTLSL
jgi:hypothetical protein